jgi:hypothetical protein
MRRREFITLLGGAATWPLAARAQQGAGIKRLGILMVYPEGDQEGQAFLAAFREELEKLGWVEGRNIQIDTRWAQAADGSHGRLRESACALPGNRWAASRHEPNQQRPRRIRYARRAGGTHDPPRSAAELVERRAEAKGNARHQSMLRTLCRVQHVTGDGRMRIIVSLMVRLDPR